MLVVVFNRAQDWRNLSHWEFKNWLPYVAAGESRRQGNEAEYTRIRALAY